MTGVKEVTLVPSGESAVAPAPVSGVEMFERLACDPNTTVEKLDGLMSLWERMQAKRAEAAFNAAMSVAQDEMKPVATDAYNPQTKSRYASYEALDKAIRPIYTKHGFGLSFNTVDCPLQDYIRIVCKATHRDGHAELYRLDMPADGKGAKGGDVMTRTHATGAAITYGQRYLLKMIWNIAVGEGDDDGNAAAGRPASPPGFADWWDDMIAVAEEGTAAVEQAWKTAKAEYKTYVVTHLKAEWNALKAKAAGKGRK